MLDKIFKRLIDFGGDAFALMHELEEQEDVHFSWHDDPLFNNKIELIKIPGVGYRIGTYSTLLHILRNRVYKGTWVTGNKEYPKNHEAIVDEKTWDLVQYLLDKRQEGSHVHPRNHSQTSMLTGLILRPDPKYIVSVFPTETTIRYICIWIQPVSFLFEIT